jgi:hypothetical protein
MTDTHSLNLKALLDFYDNRVPESAGHASEISAAPGEDLKIELLTDYSQRHSHKNGLSPLYFEKQFSV